MSEPITYLEIHRAENGVMIYAPNKSWHVVEVDVDRPYGCAQGLLEMISELLQLGVEK